MVYYEAYNPESELYHWGIKGMKWGIRRYQNPDGTLTEAGKRRYGTAENFNNVQKTKAEKAASNKAAKEAKAQARRAAAEERAKMAVEKAIKNGNVKQIMKNRSDMTTQQLRDALDRASIVKRIDELNGKKPGLLTTIASGGNKLSGAVNAVASIGESVKRVKKAFKEDDNKDEDEAFREAAKKAALSKVTKDIMGTDKKDPLSVDEAREQYRQAMREIGHRKSASEKAGNKAGEKAAEKVIELEKKKAERDAEKAAKKKKKKKQPSLSDRVQSLNDISLNHSDYDARERVGSILMHHGILGMKWGIRRYQNADGSLTAAGRKRYLRQLRRQESKEAARNRVNFNAVERQYHLKENAKMLTHELQQLKAAEGEVRKYFDDFAKTAGSDSFNKVLKSALDRRFGSGTEDDTELRKLTEAEYNDALKGKLPITSTYAFDLASAEYTGYYDTKRYQPIYDNWQHARSRYNKESENLAAIELDVSGRKAMDAWHPDQSRITAKEMLAYLLRERCEADYKRNSKLT